MAALTNSPSKLPFPPEVSSRQHLPMQTDTTAAAVTQVAIPVIEALVAHPFPVNKQSQRMLKECAEKFIHDINKLNSLKKLRKSIACFERRFQEAGMPNNDLDRAILKEVALKKIDWIKSKKNHTKILGFGENFYYSLIELLSSIQNKNQYQIEVSKFTFIFEFRKTVDESNQSFEASLFREAIEKADKIASTFISVSQPDAADLLSGLHREDAERFFKTLTDPNASYKRLIENLIVYKQSWAGVFWKLSTDDQIQFNFLTETALKKINCFKDQRFHMIEQMKDGNDQKIFYNIVFMLKLKINNKDIHKLIKLKLKLKYEFTTIAQKHPTLFETSIYREILQEADQIISQLTGTRLISNELLEKASASNNQEISLTALENTRNPSALTKALSVSSNTIEKNRILAFQKEEDLPYFDVFCCIISELLDAFDQVRNGGGCPKHLNETPYRNKLTDLYQAAWLELEEELSKKKASGEQVTLKELYRAQFVFNEYRTETIKAVAAFHDVNLETLAYFL